jgi:hypothetical protein
MMLLHLALVMAFRAPRSGSVDDGECAAGGSGRAKGGARWGRLRSANGTGGPRGGTPATGLRGETRAGTTAFKSTRGRAGAMASGDRSDGEGHHEC